MGLLQSIQPGGTGEGPWEQTYRPRDFLGHLERTQKSGQLSHSLFLFLVTNEEQDNIGSISKEIAPSGPPRWGWVGLAA